MKNIGGFILWNAFFAGGLAIFAGAAWAALSITKFLLSDYSYEIQNLAAVASSLAALVITLCLLRLIYSALTKLR